MATLQFKRGLESGIPTLAAGEPGWTTDTEKLYVGTGSGNILIGPGAGGVSDGDKGDIVVSSSGTVWTIDAGAVSFSKMQSISTARLLGRSTAGTGDVEQLTIGSGLSLSGGTLSCTVAGISDGDKGDITVSGSGSTWTIDNGVVIFDKMQAISGFTLVGRGVSGTGTIGTVSIGTGLSLASAVLSCTVNGLVNGNMGSITVSGGGYTWNLNNKSVGFYHIVDISTARLLGRSTAGSGDIEQITIGSGLSLSGGTLSATAPTSESFATRLKWRIPG